MTDLTQEINANDPPSLIQYMERELTRYGWVEEPGNRWVQPSVDNKIAVEIGYAMGRVVVRVFYNVDRFVRPHRNAKLLFRTEGIGWEWVTEFGETLGRIVSAGETWWMEQPERVV